MAEQKRREKVKFHWARGSKDEEKKQLYVLGGS